MAKKKKRIARRKKKVKTKITLKKLNRRILKVAGYDPLPMPQKPRIKKVFGLDPLPKPKRPILPGFTPVEG